MAKSSSSQTLERFLMAKDLLLIGPLERYGSNSTCVILQHILMNNILDIFGEIVLKWIPQDFMDG